MIRMLLMPFARYCTMDDRYAHQAAIPALLDFQLSLKPSSEGSISVEGASVMTDDTMPQGTKTHPWVATIFMEPANFYRFERDFEDRYEVRILNVDTETPDCWTVYAGCASREIQKLLESNW